MQMIIFFLFFHFFFLLCVFLLLDEKYFLKNENMKIKKVKEIKQEGRSISVVRGCRWDGHAMTGAVPLSLHSNSL